MYLLDDSPIAPLVDPLIVGSLALGLLAAGYGLLQGWTLVRHPRRGADYHVFRLDLATALLVWGLGQTLAVISWWTRIEGARMPIWTYLGLVYGATIVGLAWRKERSARWSAAAKGEGQALLPDGGRRSVVTETWEAGLLAAAGLALVTYLASFGHSYPHSIHWLTSGLAGLAGFGIGAMLKTPRAKVRITSPEGPAIAANGQMPSRRALEEAGLLTGGRKE